MPYHFQYNEGGFYLTHTGLVKLSEINEANGLIHGHSEFDTHDFQLINLLGADFSDLGQSDAKIPGAIDAVASRMRSDVKVAILAIDHHTLCFCNEYIKAAKHYGSTWSFMLFEDPAEALEWLEIEVRAYPLLAAI